MPDDEGKGIVAPRVVGRLPGDDLADCTGLKVGDVVVARLSTDPTHPGQAELISTRIRRCARLYGSGDYELQYVD